MRKILLHVLCFAAILVIVTLYSYGAYVIGVHAGVDKGWREATEQMNLPSYNEIQHLAEVCKQ